ncbi:ABC transporter substrate-binding protein [Acidianus sulfidivorans JP7]|uniref:ABC transporter substrate-binding protein n=1 Tax=Acidianus sulfidivorans JP7 TaxID=619593 RepID=A0A2U9IL10_9CREN|nr:ABC transporter substrate-binding protein [Acidianus sulfidivorans]AWR96738.1 ABC transporter substrate-binding protein [Acidianus sulfidivorans JP7]
MKLEIIAIGIIVLVAIAGLAIYESIIAPKVSTHETQKVYRIVSLTPSDTQILLSLGLGKYIVGIDIYSYNLTNMLNLTSEIPKNVTVFNQIYPVNISGLVALNPTVVIGEEGIIGECETNMQKAGLKVLLTNDDYASNFYEIEQSVMQVGKYFNSTAQAQEVINWMNQQLQNFSTTGNVTVDYIDWICPNYEFYSAGGNVFINSLIQLGGGINGLGEYSNYGPFTADSLISSNPQVLVVNVIYNLTYTEYLVNHFPGIQNTSAYKNGRIYYLSSDASYLTNEPGPLAVYAVLLFRDIINGTAPHVITWSWIEENLHPELPVY